MNATRRRFLTASAGFALTRGLAGQFAVGGGPMTTRLDLAAIDRARILVGAEKALGRTVGPDSDAASDAFLQFTLDVPTLAGAVQIDAENAAKYSAKAEAMLAAWFVQKPLRLEISGFEDLLGLSGLAEVAVAVPFLGVGPGITSAVTAWFKTYLNYLTTDKTAGLARDAKDRHGSSWLLQVAAFAKLCGDDAAMEAVRVRFRHAALRAEINADGFFPGELRTPNPFRNSLMNLDMLAGVCVLASTRFESLWDAELQDGPGMRAAVARYVPYMAKRATWPYAADQTHFAQLPGRRPVLAFAARAYAQPEYAALFLQLPELTDADLLRSLPIRQPLLWANQPHKRA